jgi:hypothetical protein
LINHTKKVKRKTHKRFRKRHRVKNLLQTISKTFTYYSAAVILFNHCYIH